VENLSGFGIAVERSMWWPGPTPATWYEGHTSAAVSALGTKWAVVPGWGENYVPIAGFENRPATINVTGVNAWTGATSSKTYVMAPHSRLSLLVERDVLPLGASVVLIESVGTDPVPILVEHSMYEDQPLRPWGAGTNTMAFRLQ